jgi:anti-sigma B factor antagonist
LSKTATTIRVIELLRADDAGGDNSPMIVAPFEIQTNLAAGALRVAVVGELDLATAPELTRRLEEAGAVGGPPIELDLSGVSFIDATGLRVLLAAQVRLNRGGRPGFAVIATSRAVRRLLELIGMSGFFGDAGLANGRTSDPGG